MCNGLPWTSLSYSGDAVRSFNVQPTFKPCRDVIKRLFSLRIWSPWYKHVNSDVKQSFDHSVTEEISARCQVRSNELSVNWLKIRHCF